MYYPKREDILEICISKYARNLEIIYFKFQILLFIQIISKKCESVFFKQRMERRLTVQEME